MKEEETFAFGEGEKVEGEAKLAEKNDLNTSKEQDDTRKLHTLAPATAVDFDDWTACS